MGMFDSAPLSSGYNPTYNPYGAGGSSGMLMQAIMPLLQQQMAGGRYMPAQFMPMQGMADQFRARQFYEQQKEMMNMAAQQDRRTYERLFLGLSEKSGTVVGRKQQDAAREISGDIAGWSPFLAQVAPEAFDAAHGRRGSAVVLAQSISRAGTNMADPTTGRIGMSLTSQNALRRELFERLVGPSANLAEMKGLGAGQAGLVLEQMRQRGLAGGPLESRQAALAGLDDSTLQRIAKDNAKPFSEVKQIRDAARTGGQGFDASKFDQKLTGDMVSSFNAEKISRSIKSMTGAVSAMREIFGDAGHPDAPMQELFAGLEALTQNSMASNTGAQIEHMVRRTQALARGAGVSLEGVMGLSAGGAALADQFGLDRMYAVQATQGALASRQAVDATGLLNTKAYGNLDADKLTLFDQRLRLASAASPAVNRMNAILRLTDQGVIKGGAAQAMADAIKAGKTSFEFGGKTHSVAMNEDDLTNLLGDDVAPGVLREAFRSTHANQEQGLQYRTMDLGRKLQREVDIDPQLRNIFASSANIALNGAGVGDAASRRDVSAAVGAAAVAAMNGMNTNDMLDPAKRRSTIQAAAEAKLTTTLRDRGINLPPEKLQQLAAQMTANGLGSSDQFLMDQRYGGIGLQGYLQANNPAMLEAYDRAMSVAEAEAAMDTSLAGLGSAGFGARLSDALQSKGTLGDALNEAIGNVSIDKISEADPRIKSFRAALKEGGVAGARQIEALRVGSEVATKELESIAKSLGLNVSGLTEQAVRQTAGPGGGAVWEKVAALQLAEQQGLDTSIFKDAGINPGKPIEAAERGTARALTERMRTTGLAIDLGTGKSLKIGGRNIGDMTDLLAIAKRHKDKLGFVDEDVDTEGEAKKLLDNFLTGRRDGSLTGLSLRELNEVDKLEKNLSTEAEEREMTITGEVSITEDFHRMIMKLKGMPVGANEAPIANT